MNQILIYKVVFLFLVLPHTHTHTHTHTRAHTHTTHAHMHAHIHTHTVCRGRVDNAFTVNTHAIFMHISTHTQYM